MDYSLIKLFVILQIESLNSFSPSLSVWVCVCVCVWVGTCTGGVRFLNSNRIIPSDYRILLLLKMAITSLYMLSIIVLRKKF